MQIRIPETGSLYVDPKAFSLVFPSHYFSSPASLRVSVETDPSLFEGLIPVFLEVPGTGLDPCDSGGGRSPSTVLDYLSLWWGRPTHVPLLTFRVPTPTPTVSLLGGWREVSVVVVRVDEGSYSPQKSPKGKLGITTLQGVPSDEGTRASLGGRPTSGCRRVKAVLPSPVRPYDVEEREPKWSFPSTPRARDRPTLKVRILRDRYPGTRSGI